MSDRTNEGESRRVPAGGGYGDSRGVDDAGPAPMDDERADAPAVGAAGIRSGSHVGDDDTKGTPPGSTVPGEYPGVDQPGNVGRPRPA